MSISSVTQQLDLVEVRKAGSAVGTRHAVNFIEGANVTLTITDDVANAEVDVTIAAASGGSPPTGSGFRHVTAGVEDAASEKVTFSDADQVTPNQGTTTTVLHGNAAGQPSFAAVSLTADVSGTLPVGNGGLGIATGTSGGVLGFTAATTLASSVALTTSQLVVGGGAGATPTPLAAGTDNFVLRMGAANPGYEA